MILSHLRIYPTSVFAIIVEVNPKDENYQFHKFKFLVQNLTKIYRYQCI